MGFLDIITSPIRRVINAVTPGTTPPDRTSHRTTHPPTETDHPPTETVHGEGTTHPPTESVRVDDQAETNDAVAKAAAGGYVPPRVYPHGHRKRKAGIVYDMGHGNDEDDDDEDDDLEGFEDMEESEVGDLGFSKDDEDDDDDDDDDEADTESHLLDIDPREDEEWTPSDDGMTDDEELASGENEEAEVEVVGTCLLYTSPSPRDQRGSRMPSSA